MRLLSRAGLVIPFVLFLALLGAAVPVPSRTGQLVPLSSHPLALALQKSSSCLHSGCADSASLSEGGGVSAREVEMVVLVRRKSIFTKIKEAFQRLGRGIKHVAQKIGQGIKHVAQKIGSGIKHVAQKIGHGIKVAAQKVGHFIKTTGAKIAKVGLKIIATVGKAVGRVVGLLPGVGKLVGKIADGISEGLNKASDKIRAHIGGKLGQAMRNMDKAQKIEGYIP